MEWIDVNDRKPPNSAYVLVAQFDDRVKVEMYFIQIGFRLNNDWYLGDDERELKRKYGYITHWMPIPDPPEIPMSNR